MSPVTKSCLISDEIAFVLLMAVVYFQVRYMMGLYSVKLREEIDRRGKELNQMNWEHQNTLDKFASEIVSMRDTANDRIQPLEGRFDALEDMLKELVCAEKKLLVAETTQLRAQLESGGLWGRQRKKLEGRVEEATQREAAWQKAASWA